MTTIKLKGNELGWLIRMAEKGYMDEKFQQWLKDNELEGLHRFLKLLMCRFHPNNFNAGHSEDIWTLTNDETIILDFLKWYYREELLLAEEGERHLKKVVEEYMEYRKTNE